MNNIESTVQEKQQSVIQFIKNKMFDIIAVFLIVAMLALHLGVLELRDVTFSSIANIALECIPFFLTSVLLATNFYTKGTFAGKTTSVYSTAIAMYSSKVDSLTGDQLDVLPQFCEEYNDKALRHIQTNILKRASISFEIFDAERTDKDKTLPPLKVLTKEELLTLYSEERVNIILKAKNVKIKGITDNILLGSIESQDSTDTGPTEQQLSKRKVISSAISYALSTLFLTLIGIKDVLQWGWIGLLVVAFKLIYILCSSYMNYFSGYNDITLKVVNHIARKTDILKQFFAWYDNKK